MGEERNKRTEREGGREKQKEGGRKKTLKMR